MFDKIQSLNGKTKLIFFKNISNYYNEMKSKSFQTHQQDTFAKIAQGISIYYHEILLLMKYLQTKPQIRNMNNNCCDLFYTFIKIRDENKDIDNQYENDENDYINFSDFVIPNHYVGGKNE